MLGASRPSKKEEQPKLRYSGNVIRTNLESIIPLLNLNAFSKLNQELLDREDKDHGNMPPNTPKFLKLNVGGTSYRLKADTILQRCNRSLLYRFVFLDHTRRLEIADDYLEATDEYFFERSALLFNPIYQYYVTGVCHRPRDICLDIFVSELAYWDVTEGLYGECCWPKPELKTLTDGPAVDTDVDDFENLKCSRFRRCVWNLIEVPESSFAARIVSIGSILAVLVSNIGLILASVPEFQVEVQTPGLPLENGTATVNTIRVPHPILDHVEACCVIWFTLEYVGKISVAANRRKVFWESLNVIDLIAILPFYMELTLYLADFDTTQLEELKGAILVVRILRVLRVIRIFKLGRYSSGLRAFAKTLQASMHQLSMLVVVLVTAIMFFSTFVYFLEKDEPETKFTSIPAAFWWCIVTMTTVGYGDLVPVTVVGKLVASGAIASGILVLALPITIIVDNFMKVQEETEQEHTGSTPPTQSHSQSMQPSPRPVHTLLRRKSHLNERRSSLPLQEVSTNLSA